MKSLKILLFIFFWLCELFVVASEQEKPFYGESYRQKNSGIYLKYIRFQDTQWFIYTGSGSAGAVFLSFYRTDKKSTENDLRATIHPNLRKEPYFSQTVDDLKKAWREYGIDADPRKFKKHLLPPLFRRGVFIEPKEPYSVTEDGRLKINGFRPMWWLLDKNAWRAEGAGMDFVYDDASNVWIHVSNGLYEPMPFFEELKVGDWFGYAIERKNEKSGLNLPLPPQYNRTLAHKLFSSQTKTSQADLPATAAANASNLSTHPESISSFPWLGFACGAGALFVLGGGLFLWRCRKRSRA